MHWPLDQFIPSNPIGRDPGCWLWWQMTHKTGDTWHVIRDTWHMACDMFFGFLVYRCYYADTLRDLVSPVCWISNDVYNFKFFQLLGTILALNFQPLSEETRRGRRRWYQTLYRLASALGEGWGGVRGGGSHADTHLLGDRCDTCSTSAIWSYRQQYFEEKDEWMKQSRGCL